MAASTKPLAAPGATWLHPERVEGRREVFGEFVGLLDVFPIWFSIVTP